jgi:hypothetical protein
MELHHVYSEELYALTILAENALADGDLERAAHWLRRAETALASDTGSTRFAVAGYFSSSAQLALLQGRLIEAERILDSAREHFPVIATPRLRSADLAMKLIIASKRGESIDLDARAAELRRLYEYGARLGGQDWIVAALWLAEICAGRKEGATELLTSYLRVRRETTRPEWILLNVSAKEPVWQELLPEQQSSPVAARKLNVAV